MFVKVAVIGLPYYLDCTYTYEIDDTSNPLYKRVKLDFNGKTRYGVILEVVNDLNNLPQKIKKISKPIDDIPLITEELLNLALWMSNFYNVNIGTALGVMLPSKNVKGLVKEFEANDKKEERKHYTLNDEQQAAFDSLKIKLNNGASVSYLWGVTGAGKTAVFLTLAKECVNSGKSVMYLVPEIGLTVQLYHTLLDFFDKKEVALIHSGITPARRIKIYKDIREGKIKIVLGTRSASFAPFENLGLIIIDEEQDSSYKNENSPSFNTRHIVQIRSKNNKCPLVAGSATPSLEFAKEIYENHIDCVYINKRVADINMPQIMCIPSAELSTPISGELQNAMQYEIDKSNQIILFLNRRGYLYHYRCPVCGWELNCPHCSVSMTYHKTKNKYICHRCSAESEPITICPNCGSKNQLHLGYGTQLVEETCKNLFPLSKILRLDADTNNHATEYIKAFEKHEADILIGTQMLSKGLNFPSVQLVGILNANANAFGSDFRGDEKLFSILTQVAGRSGRAKKGGRVIIQTTDVENPAIKALLNGNTQKFYKNELEMRKTFNFPPYSRLLRLVFRSKDEFDSAESSKKSYALIVNYIKSNIKLSDVEIINYGKCPIHKEKDYYRNQITLRCKNAEKLSYIPKKLIEDLLKAKQNNNKCYMEIDLDPINLY